MNINIYALLISFWIVFLAEMGDRTQLMAIAFATKHRAYKVILVVVIATVINFTIAVLLGAFMAHIPVLDTVVEILAAILFLVFGVTTLFEDEENPENINPKRTSFTALALTFFLAEFGDKSEITAFALSAKYSNSPLSVFTGSALGMILADCAAILACFIILKKIPAEIMRISASAFLIIFGLFDSYQLSQNLFKSGIVPSIIIISAEALLVSSAIFYLWRLRRAKN
ncbi:MAG: TMEM165/GDT1 family protein [Brevinematales bacterium]|jgi:putative Ca2+/H+ antiporter (TMEM165/GDT1 family)